MSISVLQSSGSAHGHSQSPSVHISGGVEGGGGGGGGGGRVGHVC